MGNTARFPVPLLPYDKQSTAYDRELMIDTSNYKLFIKLDGKNVDLFDEITKSIYGEGNTKLLGVTHGGTGLNVIPKNNIIYSNEANTFTTTPISEFGRTIINASSDEVIAGLNASTVNGYKVDNNSTTDGLWTASKIMEYAKGNSTGAYAVKGSLVSITPSDDTKKLYSDVPHKDYKEGWVYRVIENGTYAGKKCNVGDIVFALKNYDGTYSDDDWGCSQGNLDDDAVVTGVSLTGGTKNHVPIFYDNAGNKLQDSGKVLPDGDLVGTLSYANSTTAGVVKVKETSVANYVMLDTDNFAKVQAIDPNTIYGSVPVNKGGTGATTAEEALKNLGLTVTAEQLNTLPTGLKVIYGGTGLTDITKNAMLFASEDNMLSQVLTTSFGRDLLTSSLGKLIDGLNADMVDGLHVDDTSTKGLWSAYKVSTELENLKTYVGNKKSVIASAITDFNQTTASDADWDTIITNLRNISKDATATEDDVVVGKTFYMGGKKCTGKVVVYTGDDDNPVVTNNVDFGDYNMYVGDDADYTCNMFVGVPKGFYDGTSYVGYSEPNFIAENIKVGVTIGSKYAGNKLGRVTGTFTSDGTIQANDVLSGKIGYSQGNQVVGTMPYNRFDGTTSPTALDTHLHDYNTYHEPNGNHLFIIPPKGYYDGNTWVGWRDFNIIPENIRAGVSLGDLAYESKITGTFTSDGTIQANDVLSGKIGYSQGNQVVGTIPDRTKAYNDDGLYLGPIDSDWADQPLFNSLGGYGVQYRGALTSRKGWGPNRNLPGLVIAPPIGFYSNHINGSDNTPDRPTSYVYIPDNILALHLGITARKIVFGNTICGIAGTGGLESGNANLKPFTLGSSNVSSNANNDTTITIQYSNIASNLNSVYMCHIVTNITSLGITVTLCANLLYKEIHGNPAATCGIIWSTTNTNMKTISVSSNANTALILTIPQSTLASLAVNSSYISTYQAALADPSQTTTIILYD